MEGWKEKVKEKVALEERASTVCSLETSSASKSLLEEQASLTMEKEAEDSLEDLDLELKRKSVTQMSQVGRKPKRLRMERLEGWGVGTNAGEFLEDCDGSHLEDWRETVMPLPVEENLIQKRKQTCIQDWTGKRARVEVEVVKKDDAPEVRKTAAAAPIAKRKRQASSPRRSRRG